LKSNNQGKEQVNKFFEGSHNVETFLVKNKSKEIILLIGKANRATGIGVDYWNYQAFSTEVNEPMLEFPSLIKTPYAIFLNNNGKIGHYQVEDEYPRPVSGEANPDYFPLIITVFNGKNKESEITVKCRHQQQ
jgi:hypothetical protein